MDERGLGQRLQAARRQAGLTQQALCQAANISYSTLAKIERGAIKSPSIFTIQSLVVAMDGSLDALLGLNQPDVPLKSRLGIEFVYFDLNGCLVHYFQRAFGAVAAATGASSETVEDTFWKYNAAVCVGAMTLADFNAILAARCGVSQIDWAPYYLDAVEPVSGVADTVRWVAEHYRVGLLTNTMPGMVEGLKARSKLPDVTFDVIIDSSVVGQAKPSAAIFATAAQAVDLPEDKLLLVDDDKANVLAAKDCGWHVLSCEDLEGADFERSVRDSLQLI